MPGRAAPSETDVRDLEILVRANHPLIVLETEEPERGAALVRWVADRLGLPFITWSPDGGLSRPDLTTYRVEGSEDPLKCLSAILDVRTESLCYLPGFTDKLEDDTVVHKLTEVAHKLSGHRGAVIVPTPEADLPRPLQRLATITRLSAPSPEAYYAFVQQLLRDLRARMPLRVKLSGDEVGRLIAQLQGLTLFEVKKILTKVVVEDGHFTANDIPRIAEAKRDVINASGVLEYYSTEESMDEVAGLAQLKDWLHKRKAAFSEPERARAFGLSPPRGLLLLGVQGCGKSMCAKAIASAWGLPLIRLDPSRLYNKFFGESERNLRRATKTAEAMAPIVLWIDEIEKAFAQSGDQDSGTSTRIFGTLLTWMQDKKASVFVVATSNDVSRLPPELLRKGRFDEIFFVDLPSAEVRKAIFEVHLKRRGRDPARFDLAKLATDSEGFSGAEIEQAVLSALYSAFSRNVEPDTATVADEIARTVPLSVTARERIDELRQWARNRTVPAG